jgi:hypothetical protein
VTRGRRKRGGVGGGLGVRGSGRKGRGGDRCEEGDGIDFVRLGAGGSLAQ